jgi:class 3 adenylate cyclase/tetratricopeptide (TPR) repeat protein
LFLLKSAEAGTPVDRFDSPARLHVPGMISLPSGTVTFLFTDIEGSTRLIQQHPEAAKLAFARHHALLQGAIEAHRGHVFHVVGDAFCAVFDDAADALAAALDAQRALYRECWGEIGAVRVRIGLHTGTAETHDGEYVSSLTLVRVQRVTAAGHGGQTLLSAGAADRLGAQLPGGTTLRDLGAHKLRGLGEAERIFQLVAADLPSDFPPLRVEDAEAASVAPLQQLARGRLVGRGAELLQLKGHWDQTQQARGHLVLLSGEPGVGKTRLAQDLIAHAQKSGAIVLRGGCYEYEATTPYLPFVEALREWAHWQSPDQLRAALGATAAEIAKFAPEIEAKLGALAPNAPLSPNDERLRLFDNTARFLQSLAAEHGLLLFIDDVHWADQGTLSLLQYLLRHLRAHRVLVLAAYREIELDRAHPLASALIDWNRERLATRIALGRLSRADTGTLLATLFQVETISDEFTAALYRETEGNPFFIEEVVKSLIEQGEIYREGDSWGRKETHELAIPQSVKEAIGRRLNRLSDAAVDALRTAAALGKIFPFRELAAVSPTGEDALLDALDEASNAQLIRADSGGGDSFAFTHDKIREVLYEELNPIRRRRLHQRIGETLEALYAPSGQLKEQAGRTDEHAQDLAHHFSQAGDLERVMSYSRRAAQSAKRMFAHDEALKYLEQARESAEALERREEMAAIDEAIGDIHEARGVIPRAIESYERALAGVTTREGRAALKAKVGNAYVPIGDHRGLVYLEQAIAELDPKTQTNALALAMALVGRYYHYRTEHRKAIEFLERALRLAEPLDDATTLGNIYTFLAGAHQHLLLYDESDRWARAAIALGERKKSPEAIASGNEFLAENAAGRGLWDDALVYAAKDADAGRRSGSLARVAWSEFSRVQALHGKGELAAALQVTLSALELCEQIGEERLATWFDPMAAIAAADLADDTVARTHAERGWARAGRLGQLVLSAWALNALGYAASVRGDSGEALEWYGQYVVLVSGNENAVMRNIPMGRAAEAYFNAGRTLDAARLAEQAVATAEMGGAPHFLAVARRVQGRILAAQEDYDGALRAFDAAIAQFEQLGSRLELGRATLQRAALWLARGDAAQHEVARTAIAAARVAFITMGAARDAALAERLLGP